MCGRFSKYTGVCLIIWALIGQPFFSFGYENNIALADESPLLASIGLDFYTRNNETFFEALKDNANGSIFQEKADLATQPAGDRAAAAAAANAPVQPVAPQNATPAAPAPKVAGLACIRIPAKIAITLTGAPTPPDAKMKDGKLICHVLADGKKDNPHNSNKNPKGQWGGCCYDPDEVPNPKCCYPSGSVYEKPLSNYFKHPFPLRK